MLFRGICVGFKTNIFFSFWKRDDMHFNPLHLSNSNKKVRIFEELTAVGIEICGIFISQRDGFVSDGTHFGMSLMVTKIKSGNVRVLLQILCRFRFH